MKIKSTMHGNSQQNCCFDLLYWTLHISFTTTVGLLLSLPSQSVIEHFCSFFVLH